MDDAKAAAQSDYETRIMAALEHTPQDDPRVKALVEAAAALVDATYRGPSNRYIVEAREVLDAALAAFHKERTR